jgi:hypothetical protein
MPIHTTEKIAFVIVVDWALDHIEKITLNFKNNEYDLIYVNLGEAKCRDYAAKYNCNVFSIQEVIKRKLCYRLAVTTHGGMGNDYDDKFNYGIELIASKILFIASLIDYDYCELLNMNLNNYIICANEYQKKQLEKIISGDKLFVLGLPRMKDCKHGKETAKEIVELAQGIDPNKKTLLWLPTHTKVSPVVDFAPVISKLQNEINIIIKPHQFLYYEISDFDNFMRNIIPEIIIINDVDSVKLIPLADFVVCDYGGSVFYAIYADKNVILLNTPKPELLTGVFAPNVPSNIIRNRVVNFFPNEEEKFFAALKDDSVWEKQKEVRAQIRAEFFTENPDPARDIAELCRRIVKGEL